MLELADIPKTKPSITVCHRANAKKYGLVLGIASDGDRVVAVGGQGRDLLLVSTNGGKTFTDSDSKGNGLRGVHVRDEQVWVVGEWGHCARSNNFGKTWKKIPLPTRGCLFGIVEDGEGNLWLAGDAGFIAMSKDGTTFTRVKGVSENIGRIWSSPLGLLVPTDNPGHLFIGTGKKFRKTSLEGDGGDMMAARVTSRGTLLVVGGNGGVYRSTDAAETFERLYLGPKGLFAGIECFEDGRVIIVGERGAVFWSRDDGQTFKRVPHSFTKEILWCAHRHLDSILVGGSDGLVLRIR